MQVLNNYEIFVTRISTSGKKKLLPNTTAHRWKAEHRHNFLRNLPKAMWVHQQAWSCVGICHELILDYLHSEIAAA